MAAAQENRIASAVAAVVLATLTLTVFFLLQNYGPESAVRRFHHAVATNDDVELARVTKQDIRSQSVGILRRAVGDLLNSRSRIQLGTVDRKPKRVVALFQYYGPVTVTIPWVVVKEKAGWLVDADATVLFGQ